MKKDQVQVMGQVQEPVQAIQTKIRNRHELAISVFALLFTLCVCGCAISEEGAWRDNKGQLISATPSEVAEAQERLKLIRGPEDVPPTAEGGVIFDGTVSAVKIERNGLYVSKFDVDKIIYGTLENAKQVIILSPPLTKGGIDFQQGKRYRVFTVFIKDHYRTWNSTGTSLIRQ